MDIAGLKILFDADFSAVYAGLAQANTMLQSFAENTKRAFSAIPDFKSKFNFSTNGASQAAQDAREYARAAREAAAADRDRIMASIAQQREADRQANKNKGKDEYGRLAEESRKLTREYYNAAAGAIRMGDTTAATAAKLEELRRKAKEARDQLLQIESGAGNFQRQVGNYAVGSAALAQQLRQITTEIPNFFLSARIGFQSLSNNLPGIFNELTRIREANAALAASGQPTISVFKQFLGAFNPLNIAIGVGVGLLTAYGPKLLEMAKNMSSGTEASRAAAAAAKAYGEATKKATEESTNAAVKEQVNADLLYKATQNLSLSMDERRLAARALIDLAPNIFKGLSDEAIIAGKATTAYNLLTGAIKEKIAVAVGEKQAESLLLELTNAKNLVDKNRELAGINDKLSAVQKRRAELATSEVKSQEHANAIVKERLLLSQQEKQLNEAARKTSGVNTLSNSFFPNKEEQIAALNALTDATVRYGQKTSEVNAIRAQVDKLFEKPGKEKTINDTRTSTDALAELIKRNKIADAELLAGATTFEDTLKKKISNYRSYIVELTTSKLNLSIDSGQVQNAFGEIEGLTHQLEKLSKFNRIDTSFGDGKQFAPLITGMKQVAATAIVSSAQFKEALIKGFEAQEYQSSIDKTIELFGQIKALIADTLADTAALVGEGIGNIISGAGSIGDLFKGIGSLLGEQIIALGKQLITAGITMSAVWKAINALASSGPIGAVLSIAAGIAAVAAGTAIKNALSKKATSGRTKFATGGVVYGPTNALVGEYSGARGNPEVIAPLDKLTSIFKQQGIGNKEMQVFIPEVEIKGQDLRLIFNRSDRSFKR